MQFANLKSGDIFAFSGRCWQSDAINIATYGLPRWGISHVGIVAGTSARRLLLFESTSLSELPCEITGGFFAGTQAHLPGEAVECYEGRVWHYPLYRSLYSHEQARLWGFLLDTIRTPYDEIGAMRSGGDGLSWCESLFRSSDLSAIFCSEWVAASYCDVGLYPTDNVSRWNPNKLIRTLRRRGVIGKPTRLK